jgi:hypothetical protein
MVTLAIQLKNFVVSRHANTVCWLYRMLKDFRIHELHGLYVLYGIFVAFVALITLIYLVKMPFQSRFSPKLLRHQNHPACHLTDTLT